MVPAAQGGTPAQQLLAAPGTWGRGDGLRARPPSYAPPPPHGQRKRLSVGPQEPAPLLRAPDRGSGAGPCQVVHPHPSTTWFQVPGSWKAASPSWHRSRFAGSPAPRKDRVLALRSECPRGDACKPPEGGEGAQALLILPAPLSLPPCGRTVTANG